MAKRLRNVLRIYLLIYQGNHLAILSLALLFGLHNFIVFILSYPPSGKLFDHC